MKSAHQPVSLAVHARLSPQFRSDSRPSDFRKPPDRPLSVASVSPVEGLSATHYPLVTTHSPLTTFRINTCKSVSKQTTLTTFRINTYKKTGEGGTPTLPRLQRPASSVQHPASRTVCVTWRLYPLCPHSIAHTSRRHGGGCMYPVARATARSSLLVAPLFSYSYKSLFPQNPLFHIHTNPPGVPSSYSCKASSWA